MLNTITNFKEGYLKTAMYADEILYNDFSTLKYICAAFYLISAILATFVVKRVKLFQKAFVGGSVAAIALELVVFLFKGEHKFNGYVHCLVLTIATCCMMIPLVGELTFVAGNSILISLIFTLMFGTSMFIGAPVFALMFLSAAVFAKDLNLSIVCGRCFLLTFSILMFMVYKKRLQSFASLETYEIPLVFAGVALFNVFIEMFVVPKVEAYQRKKRIERIYESNRRMSSNKI